MKDKELAAGAFPYQPNVRYKYPYQEVVRDIMAMKSEKQMEYMRWLFQNDLFALLYFGFSRRDVNGYGEKTQFVVDACLEVENGPPSDTVDLWAREHCKSTIITQGKTVQDLLNISDLCVGIFSHIRPIAKDFLRPLKRLFETENLLTACFPDLFWKQPRKEAPVWSMDDGLCLKRSSEGNTYTLEAWGLVDGMPTGKHFGLRVYDDVVTERTVSTPEQINKAANAFRLSDNLGTHDGWQRIVGTIYDHGDYYSNLREESELGLYPWHVRVKPWFDKERFKKERIKYPVLLTTSKIKEKQAKQGPYIFAAQMELDPSNEEMRVFRESWLRWYQKLPDVLNYYLFVDPANEKKKDSDFTAMAVVALDALNNRYLIDMVRDRLSLRERWQALKKLVYKYPDAHVFYEKYGMQSDISYFEEKKLEEGVYFAITEMGGKTGKDDRIRRMEGPCADGRFYLPLSGIMYRGEDLVMTFIQKEYNPFPFSPTKDMFDAISRIEDPQVAAVSPVQPSSEQDYWTIREQQLEENEVEGI